MFVTLLNAIFLSFFPDSSFKEFLDDPYAELKSFADSALSKQDSSDGEKVMDSLAYLTHIFTLAVIISSQKLATFSMLKKINY